VHCCREAEQERLNSSEIGTTSGSSGLIQRRPFQRLPSVCRGRARLRTYVPWAMFITVVRKGCTVFGRGASVGVLLLGVAARPLSACWSSGNNVRIRCTVQASTRVKSMTPAQLAQPPPHLLSHFTKRYTVQGCWGQVRCWTCVLLFERSHTVPTSDHRAKIIVYLKVCNNAQK
jgi:hypothetical protein